MRTSLARLLVPIVAAMALAASMPAAPAAAAGIVYEVHYVKSVGGALIRVEIERDTRFDAAKQPVILTYSPYNSLNGSQPAADGIAQQFVPQGYARAVADVLGTRGSTGCWDYGGRKEQQSGVDVVKYLAHLPWSNGNVGMTGVSYDGTTATMVAATGIPELKAIVPVAGISHWYGYAYGNGVRYFLNTRAATDEGFDTPLLFDFGLGDTVPTDPGDPHFAEAAQARAAECGATEHTMQAYSREPDYGAFWKERDYLRAARAGKFRAATLIVHGWQDYNVKQEEATDLYRALEVDDPRTGRIEGAPFKMLWMTQSNHADGSGPGYLELLDDFWAQTLKGDDRGLPGRLPVTTLGRTHLGPLRAPTHEKAWPPPTTRDLTLHLGRSFDPIPGAPQVGPVGSNGEIGTLELKPQNDGAGWSHVDDGTTTEEVTLRDPLNRTVDAGGQGLRGHGYYSLFHESAPLKDSVRLVGSARLDAWVNASSPDQQLDPLLVEVLPDGSLTLVERGFLNLSYRNGLSTADPATGWMHATVTFLPQDYTFLKGSRIGLILQGSNTAWGVPGSAGLLSYADGPVQDVTKVGTRLILPIAGLPRDPSALIPR
ncbi:MAG TPA: CocE/NonD family hydrolase [Actinomycetota bacterium]|nr:CocE/NonD family hydrolase [Actinomycetota bacterium]